MERVLILISYLAIRLYAEILWLLGYRKGPLKGINYHHNPNNALQFQAYVYSDFGVVIDKNWKLVASLSPTTWGNIIRHNALHKLRFSIISQIENKTLLLSSHQHQNYFHWLFDIIPRLEFVEDCILTFQHIIVNNKISFQADSLEILKIPSERITTLNYGQLAKVDSLVAPPLEGGVGGITKRKVSYVRKKFLTVYQNSNNKNRKLYISRSDAASRRVSNEADVIEYLSDYDFEIITLSKLSFSEQVSLFKESTIVLAPHGAGLANAVFMDQESVVVEFMPKTYQNDCFKKLSFENGLNFIRVLCKTSDPQFHDMIVDLRELIKIETYFKSKR